MYLYTQKTFLFSQFQIQSTTTIQLHTREAIQAQNYLNSKLNQQEQNQQKKYKITRYSELEKLHIQKAQQVEENRLKLQQQKDFENSQWLQSETKRLEEQKNQKIQTLRNSQLNSSLEKEAFNNSTIGKIGLYDINYKENEKAKQQKYQKELEQQIQQNKQLKEQQRKQQEYIDQNQSCDYFLPRFQQKKQKIIGNQTVEPKQKQSVLEAYQTRKQDAQQEPWYYEKEIISEKIASKDQKNKKIQDEVYQDFINTQKQINNKRFGNQQQKQQSFIDKIDDADRIRSQKKKVDFGDIKQQSKIEKQKQMSKEDIAMFNDYINYNEEQYQLKQDKLKKQQEYRKILDEQVKEKKQRDSDLIPEEELKILGDPNKQIDAPF